MAFIYFSCLTEMSRISSTLFNNISKSRHSILVHNLIEKTCSFCIPKMTLVIFCMIPIKFNCFEVVYVPCQVKEVSLLFIDY